ncbi:DNA-binding response regulator [Vibrio coralliilyticus ATCC BAA-450]|nr:DNA-binding response regulator [Vibrio coralliilyticus ATCC BAA-450]
MEDEPRLGEQIIEALEQNGWVPELSADGIDALYRATSENGMLLYSTLACQSLMV